MLNSIIRFSLRQPLLILAMAVLVLIVGTRESTQLPIDVFPDLNRPRVVIITEAHGMAPEEVETIVNIPIESVLNGATGVVDVRSTAGVGISVIYAEFDWGTDIYTDRQIVDERLKMVSGQMPKDVEPKLAPISSIMGQVMLVGMYIDKSFTPASGTGGAARQPTTMLQLREDADWIVRKRLMKIKGVAQVFAMGGENGGQRQVQVLVDPAKLRQVGVTLHQVEEALEKSNENATGGYVVVGPNELLVRSLGRIESLEDLKSLVIDGVRQPPVLLRQVAEVKNGPEISRGLAAVNVQQAVMLVVVKQPGTDTRRLCRDVDKALKQIQPALPPDVRFNPEVYRMDSFIDRSIENVVEALRDGGILVVIILFIFLLNFRTTFITLTAIPLSICVTLIIFRWLDLSINTMTLGGLAVAIGELVDDAIVDVENIYRRLRENSLSSNPQSPLRVVFKASVEVRNSIVFGTMIVVLVFLPIFALGGMEGRLFTPLGVAYIVSILASLLVSLTVTPVLCCWLLPRAKFMHREKEGPVLRFLHWISSGVIAWSLRHSWLVIVTIGILASMSVLIVVGMGRNFLPPFNEGSMQVNVILPPGSSLEESNRIATQVERKLLALDDVVQIGRRTGRASEDEHAEGVNASELILSLKSESHHSREELIKLIGDTADSVPGVVTTTEQPISHLMSHMISGVKAQIAIKVFGDDLQELRNIAKQIQAEIKDVKGVDNPVVEKQVLIPQLQIRWDRSKLAQYGLKPGDVNHILQTAMQGREVSTVLEGEAMFDLVVRLTDEYRENIDSLGSLAIELPSGGTVALADVADILPNRMGPNIISRENGRRWIYVQCNTSGRALSAVRDDIQRRLRPIEEDLPKGYYIEYGGQFESEQSATRLILILSVLSVLGIFLVLYVLFRSVNLSLQVMSALPMAAIGAVTSLLITGQSLSVPSMVGFISLAGIASRNGILLISHYLHLLRHEGEQLTREMVVRAGKERVAPVLMTALTSGIGLVPLALAGGESGKEILYPVATVIIGGLISSTLLDFFVHPALFWKFGRNAAQRLIAMDQADEDLLDDK